MDVPLTKTAYEDPATRWARRRTAAFRLSAFLLSLASFVAWLYVVLLTPVWTLWILFPALFVLIYLAMLNTARVLAVRALRRILKVYPWQSVPGAASIANNGTTRFSFTDPECPDKTVSLGYGSFLGSGYTFWVRKVRSGEVDEVWFAGAPRFLGVVAVPGPRRLFGVAQRTVVDDRMSARAHGVNPEARERARAPGARVG